MSNQRNAEEMMRSGREAAAQRSSQFITNEKLKKKLQPGTEANYARALRLWDAFEKDEQDASPNDIATSKKFVWVLALSIQGREGNPLPSLGSVHKYYDAFSAACGRAYAPIDPEVYKVTDTGKVMRTAALR